MVTRGLSLELTDVCLCSRLRGSSPWRYRNQREGPNPGHAPVGKLFGRQAVAHRARRRKDWGVTVRLLASNLSNEAMDSGDGTERFSAPERRKESLMLTQC